MISEQHDLRAISNIVLEASGAEQTEVIVTDPIFEQIAEYVERIGFTRRTCQKREELRHHPSPVWREVQVRNEKAM